MEVILLQDVEQVGLRGDVVNVARGYMRNFLQPRGLAQPATPALLAELEKREGQRARHEARDADQAEQIAQRIGATVLRFEVKSGPRGRLFGSVTPTNVVDELWAQEKIRIDRRKLDLPETIKRIGRYTIPVTVFEDVAAEISLKDGTALHVTAAEGVVDTKTRVLEVSGGMRLVSADGYNARTSSAVADLNAGTVHGEHGIEAEGSFGRLTAQRFALDRNTRQLRFSGNVHMVLDGNNVPTLRTSQ